MAGGNKNRASRPEDGRRGGAGGRPERGAGGARLEGRGGETERGTRNAGDRAKRPAGRASSASDVIDPVRLQKYLADCGVASRRHSEVLIAEGRVSVNGRVVTAMGTKVLPGKDAVTVDGELVELPASGHVYYLFHKPRGAVVTASDPEGRRTIYDYLEDIEERVVPVGRLDRDSEGLLLLTNDGELAHRMMHPSFGVEKEYEVLVEGEIGESELDALREGVEIEPGVVTSPARVHVIADDDERAARGKKKLRRRREDGDGDEDARMGGIDLNAPELLDRLRGQSRAKQYRRDQREAKSGLAEGKAANRVRLSITITEGRKRQVRLMIAAVGGDVRRLRRVREGILELGDLPYGRHRRLTRSEVEVLREELGLP